MNLRGTADQPYSDHYGLRIHFSLEPSSNSVDAVSISKRRAYALQLLQKMEDLLAQESSEDFIPYRQRARMLREQLESRQGVFNDYFEKFN